MFGIVRQCVSGIVSRLIFGIVCKRMFGIMSECLFECVSSVFPVCSRYYVALDNVSFATLNVKQIRLSTVAIGPHA